MKLTISIEDLPDGKVKVVSDPSFEKLMRMDISGEHFTAAMGYAFFVINQIRDLSKRAGPIVRKIPKLIC
jgi:hypothetical protein